jgi:catechol 2,3-dioxygenase-like lactoylglutathione lyase family enzyme
MPSATVLTPPLHHVNLMTTRLQEMIDWYGTVVGLRRPSNTKAERD